MFLFVSKMLGLSSSRNSSAPKLLDLGSTPLQRHRPTDVSERSGLCRGHSPQISTSPRGQFKVPQSGSGKRIQPEQTHHTVHVFRYQ